jgi:hypothetical protein
LVYLGINNEEELIHWTQVLEYKDIQYVEFREPDLGNQLTAIACLTDKKIFKKLKLLSE